MCIINLGLNFKLPSMKLQKLCWIKHDEAGISPIYSIDINPVEQKFATAGHNDSSGGLVVIWNLAVLTDSAEGVENMPRQLCRLENHTASVNCVRWSHRGTYLASSANDRNVMIWQYVGRVTQQTNFGGRLGNIERWKCVGTLQGHNGDVLHVAWSPDDSLLASCSVDNRIVVWNGLKFGEMVTVIKGHDGMVKGVAWDPIGKYLASQSADKSLKVWSTSNWSLLHDIKEPFEKCTGTTQVLRLDWSPDGDCLISAHALNNDGPVAKIIPRDFKMDQSVDFVGHRRAVECVRYCSSLFARKKSNKLDAKMVNYSVVALGSKDKSISIWMVGESRPVIVLNDSFKQSVMDLSWSSNGRLLLACSMDGSVVGWLFEEGELGTLVTTEMKNRQLIDKYGAVPTVNGTLMASENGTAVLENGGFDLIENPEIWKARQKVAAALKIETSANTPSKCAGPTDKQVATVANDVNRSSPSDQIKRPTSSASGISEIAGRQIETRLPNGKRRILPVFVSAALEPSTSSNLAFDAAKDSTTVAISSTPSAAAVVCSSVTTSTIATPIVVDTTKTPNNGTASATNGVNSVSTTKDSAQPQVVWKRTKSDVMRGEDGQHPHKKLKDKDNRNSTGPTVVRTEAQPPQTVPEVQLKPSSSHTAAISTTTEVTRRLSVPPKTKTLMVQLNTESGVMKISVANETKVVGDVKASLISCVRKALVWESLLRSPALALTVTNNVVAVACENQTLSIYSTATGATIASGIVTGSSISTLCSCSSYVMVVTATGQIVVWNCAKRPHQALSDVSLSQLITGENVTIRMSRVTDTGVPIIGLSTDSVYAYDDSMKSWVMLVDSHDLMLMAGEIQQPAIYDRTKMGPVATVMQAIKLTMPFPGTFAIPTATRKLCTTGFFEQQMQASLVLKSPGEYRHWLMQFVTHLVRHGEAVRLKEILDEFLEGSSKQELILGMERRDLLEELLPLLAVSNQLQRLSADYRDALNQIPDLMD